MDYIILVRYLDRVFQPLRASTPTASIFILMALFDDMGFPILKGIALGLLILCFIVGFLYFKRFPLDWDECDDDQKWLLGQRMKLKSERRSEWIEI